LEADRAMRDAHAKTEESKRVFDQALASAE
jgi:hypothetical protein